MSNTDQAPEPSMEEILSSIRRIISDDNDPSSAEEEAVADAPEELPEPVVEEPPVEDKAEPEPAPEVVEDVAEPQPEPEPEPANEDDDDDIFELTKVVEIEDPVIDMDSADDKPDMSEFEVETTEGEPEMEIADCGADVEDDIEFVDVETGEPEVMALPELGPEPVLENDTPDEVEVADRLVSEGVGVATAASFGDLANTLLSRGNNASTLEELVQEMLRPLLKDWLDTNLPTLVEKLVSEEIERIARRGR